MPFSGIFHKLQMKSTIIMATAAAKSTTAIIMLRVFFTINLPFQGSLPYF